jgi:GntR family transcriptional regulator, arabinose operon transcriptional repressor
MHALSVFGAPVELDLVKHLNSDVEIEVRQVMETLRPEAIVCANDRIAGNVMDSLLRLNYRIPEDIRIVGIDDVEYANLLPFPLTTVHQPCREIGVAAMAAMLERVTNPDMPVRDTLQRILMMELDDGSLFPKL